MLPPSQTQVVSELLGIAICPVRKQPMQLLQEAELCTKRGVVGDARGQAGPRQVTMLSLKHWQIACAEVGVELPWEFRRANLLVTELPFIDTAGKILRIGEACLEITGETDPCKRMEQLHPGLFNALRPDWRGGITARVLQGGPLKSGMFVEIL